MLTPGDRRGPARARARWRRGDAAAATPRYIFAVTPWAAPGPIRPFAARTTSSKRAQLPPAPKGKSKHGDSRAEFFKSTKAPMATPQGRRLSLPVLVLGARARLRPQGPAKVGRAYAHLRPLGATVHDYSRRGIGARAHLRPKGPANVGLPDRYTIPRSKTPSSLTPQRTGKAYICNVRTRDPRMGEAPAG